LTVGVPILFHKSKGRHAPAFLGLSRRASEEGGDPFKLSPPTYR
jgi:hypothetical protein